MKRPIVFFSLSALALTASTALAQETFLSPLDSDYSFSNGVLLQGVTTASDGVAEILLDGAGTLTVSSVSGGGFPRLIIYGGTTLKSTRVFAAEELNKTTWSGQLDAPSSGVKPGFFEINDPGAGFADNYEAVEAFGMGLANEAFTFSSEADFVFPTGEQDGQKLYVANQKDDGTWDVSKSDFCIVNQNLCALPLVKMNKVALIKEKFETCPQQNIANGSVGSTPGCIYSCNDGFELNEDATACEAAVSNEAFENSFQETTTETTTNQEQQLFENQIVAPVKEYNFPPGHFRYRASGEKFYRYLDQTGLDGEVWAQDRIKIDKLSDQGKTRHVNSSYLSRNPRTAEEQLAAQANNSAVKAEEHEEDFLSYLIQMRNYFGAGAQENNFTAMSAEGGSETTQTAQDGEEGESTASVASDTEGGETFLSSGGGLLPSTGPGVFVTIAVVGFALMMFGARQS